MSLAGAARRGSSIWAQAVLRCVNPGRGVSVITVVGGVKGGTGKSTVATNLAVMHAIRGWDVLLVDADEQGTATDFSALRNQNLSQGASYTCISLIGRALATEIRRLAPKY